MENSNSIIECAIYEKMDVIHTLKKLFNIFQLFSSNQNKKILYVTPSIDIVDKYALKDMYKNVNFMTYTKFTSLSEQVLKQIEFDMLILDDPEKFNYLNWQFKAEMLKTLNNNASVLSIMYDQDTYINWLKMYRLAEIYYEHNKKLLMSKDFKTNDGYTYDENGLELGKWIFYNRDKKDNLSNYRKYLLNKIGMIWNIKDYDWFLMLQKAKDYYCLHGNFNNVSDKKLKNWINYQKYNFYSFTEERQILLGQIGITNKKKIDINWQEKLDKIFEYYLKNENFNNLKNKQLKDWINYQIIKKRNLTMQQSDNIGKEYTFSRKDKWVIMYLNVRIYYQENKSLKNIKDIQLVSWLNYQRNNKHKLSIEQQKLLEEIDIDWAITRDKKRKLMLQKAKLYYQKYGNLIIQNDESLKNWLNTQRKNKDKCTIEEQQELEAMGIQWVISNDEKWNLKLEKVKQNLKQHGIIDDESLKKWLNYQRRNKDKLTIDQQHQLEDIDTPWTVSPDKQWDLMIERTKQHFQKNGNLIIDDDEELKKWLANKRRNKNSLSKERKMQLSQNGMIWGVRENKQKILNICYKYKINYYLNKDILEYISIQEFDAKIKYLMDNKIAILNEDGRLHEIFRLSSVKLQEKYGINLEELILNYLQKEEQLKSNK